MSETNGYMTLDDWLTPDQREYKDIEVEGRKLRIRTLMEEERSRMEAPNFTKKGEVNIEKARDTVLRAICESVVNTNNEPYLTYHHIAAMRKKSSKFIAAAYAEIAEFCGLKKDSLEDAEKNFEPTPAAASQ